MTISFYEKEADRIEEIVRHLKEVTDEMGDEGFSMTAVFCALHYTELVFENIIIDYVQNMPEDKRPEFLKGPNEYVDSIRRVAKIKFMLEKEVYKPKWK